MGKRAKTSEIFLLGVFFGIVPIVAPFIATFVFTAIVFGKDVLDSWTLWALLPGLFIDIIFLKRWVQNAYTMSNKIIGAMYIFYSICAIGFFMGIPIGNIFLGILAGIYAARKIDLMKVDKERRDQYFKNTAKFSAMVMILICCLITLWAIAGKMIGSKFETPFLSFIFTIPIFFTIALVGGTFLVLLQYFLTGMSANLTYEELTEDALCIENRLFIRK